MEIKVVKQIFEWNEDVSAAVKAVLSAHSVCLINVMGSPGAGKTSLITKVIEALGGKYRIGVIEGDIAGTVDAEHMRTLGVPVVQLQTDGACHIEAMSIQNILPMFELDDLDVIFVENIGNLVCPAEFNIGENFRVAVLSIPEGHDKVEKYPLLFATTDALVINKTDAAICFDFDMDKAKADFTDINPKADLFPLSSKTGDGMEEFLTWLDLRIEKELLTACHSSEEGEQ